MTASIKRMLAEQVAIEARRGAPVVADPINDLMDIIDRAAPFIDEQASPNSWRPSLKLKLAFFALGTDANGRWAGTSFIERMLDKARQRWIDGFYADPWENEPRVRGGAAR